MMATKMASIANGNGQTNFTLHVTNLPTDLEKEGVSSIFREYGDLIAIMVVKGRNNTNQAYVTYATYSEAESAINELHEKLPLMLNIQFKDKNLKNLSQPVELDLSQPIHDFRYNNSYLDHIPNVKKVIDIGRVNCTPVIQRNTYTPDDELLYPVPNDTATYDPYDPLGPYNDTNIMYTRGIAHVSRDGRRRISYGRGYTYYNLPEPHCNIAAYLQNVCERRENGIYEYAPNEEESVGVCKICSTSTAFRCQKCDTTFYCGKSCQVKDWPKHKLECSPIPPLIKKTSDIVQSSKISEIDQVSISPMTHKVQDTVPLRRPKTDSRSQQQERIALESKVIQSNQVQQPSSKPVIHPEKASSVKSTSSSKSASSAKSTNGIKNEQIANANNSALNKQSMIGDFKVAATCFPSKQSQQQNQNEQKASSSTAEDNIVFQSNTFIPKDAYVKVMISNTMGDGEYWVQKVEDVDEISQLFEKLKEHITKVKPVELEENMKCIISQPEEGCSRVTIVKILDNSCTVFYHDFGTFGEAVIDKVYPMTEFEDLPFYARRIRLVKGTDPRLMNLPNECDLSVKALSVEMDGTIIVETNTDPNLFNPKAEITEQLAQCSISDNSEPQQRTSQTSNTDDDIYIKQLMSLPNVLDISKVKDAGCLIFHAELSKYEYNITLVPEDLMQDFSKLLEEMKNDCEALAIRNSNYSPNVGDFVCAYNEPGDDWYRGIVMATQPVIKIAVIDEGRVFVTKKCVPVPDEYKNIRSFGLVCKLLLDTEMSIAKLDEGCYTVIQVSDEPNERATILITSPDLECNVKASIRKWVPMAEQKGLQWAKLQSGQEIQMIHVSNQNLIYVHINGSAEKERRHRLEQDIAKHALKRIPLREFPVVGQIIMAGYSVDGNYYRAIVTKIDGMKILVKFIDYGNEEVKTMDKLFELPDELKEQAACAARIRLLGVEKDTPLTEDATDKIQEFILNEVVFTCSFDGDPFVDGVTLISAVDGNINKMINRLLKPSWEKESPPTESGVFRLTDLPPTTLGDVGDEVQAIVLAFYGEHNDVILAPNDIVAAQAIQVELTEKIANYVKSTTTHYIPMDTELCIAKYEGEFYRGLCLMSSVSPDESRVFFIDFGNTERVKHTDIRKLPKDFTELEAFGILCNLTPIVSDKNFNLKIGQRISELLPVNEIITIKIMSLESDGSPNIDIPAVRIKLMEEKLI